MNWKLVPALLVLIWFSGCCSAKTCGEATMCRAAQQEIAGRLEAQKRLKGKYPETLAKLPKQSAPLPNEVNGFPIGYNRTKTGFELECRYLKSGMNTCRMDAQGAWDCLRTEK